MSRYIAPTTADRWFNRVVAWLTRRGVSVAGSRVLAVRGRRTGEGRETPVKWARTFAETVGFIHERAGRLTPMARSAQSARRRRERAQSAEADAAFSKLAVKTADGDT